MVRQMHMTNSFDPTTDVQVPASVSDLLRRREDVLGGPYRLFYREPVYATRAEGAFIYDHEGLEYLDAYNNVPVVGHCNSRVMAAVSRQLERLNTHTRYLTDEVVEYAELLVSLFPGHLEQVVFACSGSEAVDLALRMARHWTSAKGILVTSHAYHGVTTAAAEISPGLGPNNAIPEWVVLVDAPDQLRDDPATAQAGFLERVEAGIEQLRRRGFGFAAMIVDSVLSSDGLQVNNPGLLREVADLVRSHGALYIADEVQAGFGRTGVHWWGFQGHAVEPDLVVLGKPMGNGLPISAVVGRAEIFTSFGQDVRYFNTFGGNSVCVAAAHAVLDEISERHLLDSAERVGSRLADGMDAALTTRGIPAQVRRSGLFVGVELFHDSKGLPPAPEVAAGIVDELRRQRILISASGRHGNVLKVRPPLVFGLGHLPRFFEGLDVALDRQVA